jgi:hypothetical protein
MFTETNEKLQQTKDLLVDLIAELDLVLEDLRDIRGDVAATDGMDRGLESVRKIARQRDVLMNVAAMLADVRFEWSQEPQQQRKA